jgi:hypothetical protein
VERYYTLVVRTGTHGSIDSAGGIHIAGFPQLVSVREETLAGTLVRKTAEALGFRKAPEREYAPIPSGVQPVFVDEFMVEIN